MADLKDKTLFITGASRGIGKSIALRAAADGAKIVIVAKTASPHPKLPGTIHTAADEIETAGGRALAIQTDIRFEDQVKNAVKKAVETFGGIDILVNNASAIFLKGTAELSMKRFDLKTIELIAGSCGRGSTGAPHEYSTATPQRTGSEYNPCKQRGARCLGRKSCLPAFTRPGPAIGNAELSLPAR